MCSNTPYTLTKCTTPEVPEMVEVYSAAFSTDPFGQYTFSIERCGFDVMNSWLNDRFTKIMAKPNFQTHCIRDGSGRMVAFLRIVVPHLVTPKMKEEQTKVNAERKRKEEDGTDDTWPQGSNLEVCYAKFGGLDEKRQKHVDPETTYVAVLLATHPDYQRKGLASMLLRHAFEMADREGKKIYIEATDAGFPVYKRLGFVQIDEVVVDVSKWGGKELKRNRCMMREPVSEKTEVQQVKMAFEKEQEGGVVDLEVRNVC